MCLEAKNHKWVWGDGLAGRVLIMPAQKPELGSPVPMRKAECDSTGLSLSAGEVESDGSTGQPAQVNY